jgi:hypothetical protein
VGTSFLSRVGRVAFAAALMAPLVAAELKPAIAQVSALDPSFGVGGSGWVAAPVAPGVPANIYGPLMVAGNLNRTATLSGGLVIGERRLLSVLDSAGSPDPIFSGDGFIPDYPIFKPKDVEVLPDGAVLIAGNEHWNGVDIFSAAAIIKYDRFGALDLAFGSAGSIRLGGTSAG